MKITELIEGLPCALVSGPADVDVTGIAEDSRAVRPGDLFVARAGARHDGRAFVDAAMSAGAVAVLTREPGPLDGAAVLGSADVAATAGRLAERLHGHPSRRLALVGITGTNGKTTTAHLLRSLLESAGTRCGLIGTVHVDDGERRRPARLTTPPAVEISRLLADMTRRRCDACVMEVSSHALHQHRVDGLAFRGGVFTNVSGDHLDYHGTMDDYVAAKTRLFGLLPVDGFAVLNVDDPAAPRMRDACRARVIECSLLDPRAACHARVGACGIGRTECTLRGPWGRLDVALPLTGAHNVANALLAAAVAHELGVGLDALAGGLARSEAPRGRLEPVDTGDLDFDVLVDYAHTDDALANVLAAMRDVMSRRDGAGGRLRVVFGCGGDRDRTKRPRMAEVACRLADDVIITSDNPRTEDPRAIVDEVFTGVPAARRAGTLRLVDRAEAIRAAISAAGPGDVVLIAGKGHEDYQIVGTERREFDDAAVAAAAVGRRRLGVAAP